MQAHVLGLSPAESALHRTGRVLSRSAAWPGHSSTGPSAARSQVGLHAAQQALTTIWLAQRWSEAVYSAALPRPGVCADAASRAGVGGPDSLCLQHSSPLSAHTCIPVPTPLVRNSLFATAAALQTAACRPASGATAGLQTEAWRHELLRVRRRRLCRGLAALG